MTPDTEKAVFALKPLCNALSIEVWADEKRLYINGQAIGISYNSTWATLMEAVGYIFLKCYDRDFRRGALNPGQIDCVIKRYWIPKPVSDATEKTAAR